MSFPPVTVDHDRLRLGPLRLTFQRTLRIPEQGLHPLPPGLGSFPLRRVEDYPDTVPAAWRERGGVMLPVYQREAMWLSFHADEPAALQVGVGNVCAISGESRQDRLSRSPQNYAPLPRQPWLDGINAGDGFIRQFVAVPLGLGVTVEGQVTGEEVHGGVQLRLVGLTADALEAWRRQPVTRSAARSAMPLAGAAPDMGLGAGGRMRQQIATDTRPLTDYDEQRSARVFVHLCSAAQWAAITGETPPPTPVDREAYVQHGLPWFDHYDADADDLPAADALAEVTPVGEALDEVDPPFTPVDPKDVVQLKDASGDEVAPGDW
ncbi:MAG: hypothetical protein QM621_14720 [Aeromicrobium sp.]|uniref:hypothetical protein n=1 Tax=Aeromicrobium sp. TaxID=1871063 RepID=UPI0039E4D853